MKTSTNSQESNTDSTDTEPQTDQTTIEDQTPQEEDPNFDEFGYPKENKGEETPAKTEEAAEVVPPKTEETPPAKKEKSSTGYGNEEEAAEEVKPPVEKTEEEKTAEEKALGELTEIVKDLGDGFNKEKIKQFAVANKMSVDQVKAYVSMVKAEEAEAVQNQATAVKAQRKAWGEELKNDPVFGGANFDASLSKVEKLVDNHMPSVKKVLTEKGGMLPPYFMRDLLSLANKLNPTTKFVGGEPPPPKEDPKSFLDDMYPMN